MKQLLLDGAAELELSLSDMQAKQLLSYGALLKEWNERMNLTAITEDKDIATKHFLDSLTPLCTGKVGASVIDVGTGAGFPGLVLKIARPELRLTLLDSLNKRLSFLQAVTDALELEEVEFVHARAEDGGRSRLYREKFDTAVSRAVANMTMLSELCLPFVKVGGYFLALKGPAAEEELDQAKRAISILGGAVEGIHQARIPFTELSHQIIMIKKVRQTPMKYPRKPGIITKAPIESCYNMTKRPGK